MSKQTQIKQASALGCWHPIELRPSNEMGRRMFIMVIIFDKQQQHQLTFVDFLVNNLQIVLTASMSQKRWENIDKMLWESTVKAQRSILKRSQNLITNIYKHRQQGDTWQWQQEFKVKNKGSVFLQGGKGTRCWNFFFYISEKVCHLISKQNYKAQEAGPRNPLINLVSYGQYSKKGD